MLAVIAMALSVHDALHGGAARFALTFVAVRGIVLLLNARARRHAAAARPLLNLYLVVFSIGASLWLVSVFVPEPARYVLWGVALTIELSAPWVGRHQIAKAPIHASHLVERFGLFTLIVLGESVISVAQGAADVDWTVRALAAAVGGFVAVSTTCGGCTSTASTTAPSAACSRAGLELRPPAPAGRAGLGGGRHRSTRYRAAAGRLQRSTAWPWGRDGALPARHRGGRPGCVRRTTDRMRWLGLGAAALALAIGLVWPLGFPPGCSWPST
jgi:hypothetical protein